MEILKLYSFDETSKFDIKVESFTLSTTKDFIHAMGTMLPAHYVFNATYAWKAFGAIYFMQKNSFGIGDETECPT